MGLDYIIKMGCNISYPEARESLGPHAAAARGMRVRAGA